MKKIVLAALFLSACGYTKRYTVSDLYTDPETGERSIVSKECVEVYEYPDQLVSTTCEHAPKAKAKRAFGGVGMDW